MPFTPIYTNGFEDLSTATLSHEFASTGGGPSIASPGRSGNNCLFLNSVGPGSTLTVSPTMLTDFVLSAAVKLAGVAGDSVFAFIDSGSGSIPTSIQIDSAGKLMVFRDAGVKVGETPSGVVAVGNAGWTSVQVRVVFHATAGIVQVKVNNVLLLNLSNVNTKGSTTGQANQLYFRNPGGGTSYDDIVVGTGALPEGDLRVLNLALSAGSSAQFTPTGAGSNLACINQTAPDGATTYNASSTTGQKDLFALTAPAIGAASPVLGVQLVLNSATDTSSRILKPIMKSGSSSVYGSDIGVNVAFTNRQPSPMFLTNPATGQPWTVTELGGAEAGYETGA